MADGPEQSKWRWKVGNDRSRRDEIRRQEPSTDSGVVYRQKKPDRRRQDRVKKRWSVRPDVSLVVVPPGKQCHVIGAVILIFLGVFLALSGLIVLFILTDLKTLGFGIGMSMLILGVIILLIGLVFLLYVCCFKTSTRYKQYIAQYKSGEQIEMKVAAAVPLREDTEPSVVSKTTVQTQLENSPVAKSDGSSITVPTNQESETTSRTYVTANEQTPSSRVSPGSSMTDATKTQWATPSSYRPLNVRNLTEFSLDMKTAENGNYGENVHFHQNHGDMRGDIPEMTENSPGPEPRRGDFENLEEALRQMAT